MDAFERVEFLGCLRWDFGRERALDGYGYGIL